jgi:hypothetical protein
MGTLPKDADNRVVSVLDQHGLIHSHDDGVMTLDPSTLMTGVFLSKAVPEKSLRSLSGASTWEMRAMLVANGWRIVSSAKNASLDRRQMVDHSFKTYYDLLLNHLSQLSHYDAKGSFSHSQNNAYYNTLKFALITFPEDPTLTLMRYSETANHSNAQCNIAVCSHMAIVKQVVT